MVHSARGEKRRSVILQEMQIGREMPRALCRPAGWIKNGQCETVPLDLKCLYECISAYMGGQTPENMNESVYPSKDPPPPPDCTVNSTKKAICYHSYSASSKLKMYSL